MKKVLVAAILGLAAAASVQAQSTIRLYNFNNPETAIVYGTGGGGTVGQGVTGGYTVGVYYAIGSTAATVNGIIGGATTTAGANAGTMVGSGLSLGTGTGATVALGPDGPGIYDATDSYVIPGLNTTATVTLVLVAYQGSSYENAVANNLGRGHSAAFTMTATASPGFAIDTGTAGNPFAVVTVPEPSTFALAGLGLAGLLIFRRRN